MDASARGAELPPGPALHCAIFGVDIAGYGDLRRDDTTRVHMHEAMYAMLARAFTDAGVPWDEVVHEDRGDGVLAVVPGAVPHAALVDPLVRLLHRELRGYNRTAADIARIRLRAALHAGPVQRDAHGLVGEAVNHTCRLLNAAVLKETLAASPAPLAFIASAPLFDAVVRDAHADVDPETFRAVTVEEKETRAQAWIHLPGMGPARSWPAAVPEAAVAPRPAGGPAPGTGSDAGAAPAAMQGFVFHGVTHIAGDAVAGDKHVHSPVPPAAWDEGMLPRATTAEFLEPPEGTDELGDPAAPELADPARQALPPSKPPVTGNRNPHETPNATPPANHQETGATTRQNGEPPDATPPAHAPAPMDTTRQEGRPPPARTSADLSNAAPNTTAPAETPWPTPSSEDTTCQNGRAAGANASDAGDAARRDREAPDASTPAHTSPPIPGSADMTRQDAQAADPRGSAGTPDAEGTTWHDRKARNASTPAHVPGPLDMAWQDGEARPGRASAGMPGPADAARQDGEAPDAGAPAEAPGPAGTAGQDAAAEGVDREDTATEGGGRASWRHTTVREGEARGGGDDEHT